MQTAKQWIYRLDEVNSERDQEGWVKAIQKDAKEKPMATARKLKERVKQLEKELADMTMNYSNTRHQYDLRLEANDAAMKTCALLAAENEQLKRATESANDPDQRPAD